MGDAKSVRLHVRCKSELPEEIAAIEGVLVWSSQPVYYVQTGKPLFSSACGMVAFAAEKGISLGEAALANESALLGLSESEVLSEMQRRYEVMAGAVGSGLDTDFTGLQMVEPCAGRIYEAESAGELSSRSMHTRIAARTLAVLHVNSAMGVVCAAPTGGAAGVIPGVLFTLEEELGLSREQTVRAMLAAGGIGMVFATRATFAAEVAGCQVEIGAAGAMAAAAVVDACGGTPAQACDAAAIALQNTMGSVCDLLHGTVEIPCHTRNAVAAANAFVNADMIMGGYVNPIPLDETIDAVLAVGKAMPPELRCTSKGGLAVCPSAAKLKRC
jgi:L-serine dehydratase